LTHYPFLPHSKNVGNDKATFRRPHPRAEKSAP
jgi:hypothetical protein